jgi:hypothetical protein
VFIFFIVSLLIHFVLYMCVKWCFCFFQLLATILFVNYAWPLGIFFFAWFVQIFHLCLLCGCWEFSVVSVIFAAKKFVLNTFLVSNKLFFCNFNHTFCALCVCNLMYLLFFYVLATILFVLYAWPLRIVFLCVVRAYILFVLRVWLLRIFCCLRGICSWHFCV